MVVLYGSEDDADDTSNDQHYTILNQTKKLTYVKLQRSFGFIKRKVYTFRNHPGFLQIVFGKKGKGESFSIL